MVPRQPSQLQVNDQSRVCSESTTKVLERFDIDVSESVADAKNSGPDLTLKIQKCLVLWIFRTRGENAARRQFQVGWWVDDVCAPQLHHVQSDSRLGHLPRHHGNRKQDLYPRNNQDRAEPGCWNLHPNSIRQELYSLDSKIRYHSVPQVLPVFQSGTYYTQM